MKLTRTTTELDRLRSALDAAKADRARLKSEAATLDAAGRELAELTADEYLGTIAPDEFERRRAELETRRRDVQERRDRTETIVATLARRARMCDPAPGLAPDPGWA
jgi:cytochrome c-type biogenesis protein CcmH/NrfG